MSWKTTGALAGALVLSVSGGTLAQAQTKAAPAAPVTQEQLNAAAKDENNFLQTNGNYACHVERETGALARERERLKLSAMRSR